MRETVWYQIFPERFCNGNKENDPDWVKPWGYHTVSNLDFYGGDLDGIRQKLPYLQELGITGLYLTPVFESPSSHKYDTTDYRKIDPGFGDEKTMKLLVKEAHDRGIRVMLDGVFNHCGSNFLPWRDVMEKAQVPLLRLVYDQSLALSGAGGQHPGWTLLFLCLCGADAKAQYE